MNISSRAVAQFFLTGFFVYFLAACQEGNLDTLEQEIAVGALDITSIAVTAPAAIDDKMPVGDKLQFVATGNKTDGSTIDVSKMVTWSVSNTNAASIDIAGLLTSISAANIEVTAVISNIEGSKNITMANATVTSIVITDDNNNTPSIPMCSELQLKATGTYTETVGGLTFRWEITDNTVWGIVTGSVGTFSSTTNGLLKVAVNSDPITDPLPTATAVKATLSNISSLDTTVDINANITSIVITPDSPSVTVGSTVPLVATTVRSGTGAVNNDISDNMAIWDTKSGNLDTITVNSSGVVKGVTLGADTVVATCGNISAEMPVIVLDSQKMERIVIQNKTDTKIHLSIGIGGTGTDIKVDGFSANTAQPTDLTNSVTWKIIEMGNGTNVFSLHDLLGTKIQGRVIGLKIGTGGVRVTYQETTASAILTDDITVIVK